MSVIAWWSRPVAPAGAANFRPKWIFLGPSGVRAGWRVLLFAALTVGLAFAVQYLLARFVTLPDKGEVPPGVTLALEATQASVILATTAIMARLDGKSVWSYGLSGPRAVRRLLIGCCGGLLSLSALVALLAATGHLVIDGLALRGAAIPAYAIIWAIGFLLAGFVGETISRGYVQYTLSTGIGFWPAALVTSFLFAADHITNAGETFIGVTQVFVAGMVWCLLLRVTGSLWLGIGFHAAWDWAQSYLYGTPDSGWMMQGHLLVSRALGDPRISGGTDGPEGSLLSSPVMIAGALLLAWAVASRRVDSERKRPGLCPGPAEAVGPRPHFICPRAASAAQR